MDEVKGGRAGKSLLREQGGASWHRKRLKKGVERRR